MGAYSENPALLSSDSCEWGTPRPVFDFASRVLGGFDIDAAASAANKLCPVYFSKEDSAFTRPWADFWKGHTGTLPSVWLNPVYGDSQEPCGDETRCKRKRCAKRGHHSQEYVPGILDFTLKAVDEARLGCHVCMLVPARTDTEWFDLLQRQADTLIFVQGRLTFVGLNAEGDLSTMPAPFASALAFLKNGVQDKRPDITWIKARDLR